MSNREQDIESTLRQAPRPEAPADLKESLLSQVALPSSGWGAGEGRGGVAGWFRHWWPAWAPAAISIACAAVVVAQQLEIRRLRESVPSPSESASSANSPDRAARSGANPSSATSPDYQQEIARMKAQVADLKSELERLEGLKAENQKLRASLAAAGMPPELQDAAEAMQKAKEKAQKINCINNLKQFGLAVRIYANDNNDAFPPDILSISNELSTPRILVCPADTGRSPAKNWGVFSSDACSYEYLAVDGSAKEPERVLSRCPIHNVVGLCDGSVQTLGTNDTLIEVSGKYYINRARKP
jgi:regulator of replication initiation timing